MVRVHRVGRRFNRLWLLALPLAMIAAGVAMWPQSPAQATVLVATRDLAAGQEVTQSDFAAEPLRLGSASVLYLTDLPHSGILVKSMSKDEPLLASSLTESAFERRTPMVFELPGSLPRGVKVGEVVDVWATAQGLEPAAIALDCVVVSLEKSQSLGKIITTVELSSESEYLPALISAKATSEHIELLLQSNFANQ